MRSCERVTKGQWSPWLPIARSEGHVIPVRNHCIPVLRGLASLSALVRFCKFCKESQHCCNTARKQDTSYLPADSRRRYGTLCRKETPRFSAEPVGTSESAPQACSWVQQQRPPLPFGAPPLSASARPAQPLSEWLHCGQRCGRSVARTTGVSGAVCGSQAITS